MNRAGKLRKLVSFTREDTEAVDELGDPVGGTVALGSTWGRLEPLRGDERVAAQALEATFSYRLHVRLSALASSIRESDTAVVENVTYQIRSIFETERPGFIIMQVERGTA